MNNSRPKFTLIKGGKRTEPEPEEEELGICMGIFHGLSAFARLQRRGEPPEEILCDLNEFIRVNSTDDETIHKVLLTVGFYFDLSTSSDLRWCEYWRMSGGGMDRPEPVCIGSTVNGYDDVLAFTGDCIKNVSNTFKDLVKKHWRKCTWLPV